MFLFFQKGIVGNIGLIALTLSMAYALYRAFIIYKKLPGTASGALFYTAVFLIIANALADFIATAICTPDLSLESNPIFASLVDLRTPLAVIYFFMIITQILFISTVAFMISNLIKAYPEFLHAIPYKNLSTTIRWVMGPGQSTWVNYLLCKQINYFIMMSFVTVLLFSMLASRFYLALEWFKIIPALYHYRVAMVFSVIFCSSTAFVLFTHHQLKLRNLHSARI